MVVVGSPRVAPIFVETLLWLFPLVKYLKRLGVVASSLLLVWWWVRAPAALSTLTLRSVGATYGQLGRDDQAQSVTGKSEDFGRFHHLLDHGRLAAHRALGQIVHVLVDPDQGHRPVDPPPRFRITCFSREHWRTYYRASMLFCNQLWLGKRTLRSTTNTFRGKPHSAPDLSRCLTSMES